jgi:hypothetical protein
MTILKPRSRMISVRLSEDEYESLRTLCMSTGARSVSDLTRDAMQILLKKSSEDNTISGYMDDVRAQISALDHKIEVLSERIAPSKTELGS